MDLETFRARLEAVTNGFLGTATRLAEDPGPMDPPLPPGFISPRMVRAAIVRACGDCAYQNGCQLRNMFDVRCWIEPSRPTIVQIGFWWGGRRLKTVEEIYEAIVEPPPLVQQGVRVKKDDDEPNDSVWAFLSREEGDGET